MFYIFIFNICFNAIYLLGGSKVVLCTSTWWALGTYSDYWCSLWDRVNSSVEPTQRRTRCLPLFVRGSVAWVISRELNNNNGTTTPHSESSHSFDYPPRSSKSITFSTLRRLNNLDFLPSNSITPSTTPRPLSLCLECERTCHPQKNQKGPLGGAYTSTTTLGVY